MATKKMKRLQMMDRRQAFEAEMRESGLKAQARDREYRARKKKRLEQEAEAEALHKKAQEAAKKINGGKAKDG